MSQSYAALPLEDLNTAQPRRCSVDGLDLLFVLDAQGQVFAFENNCSHADKPLERGVWNPQTREMLCPFHKAVFDVGHGGIVKVGPAAVALQVYPTQIRTHLGRDFVFVEIDNVD